MKSGVKPLIFVFGVTLFFLGMTGRVGDALAVLIAPRVLQITNATGSATGGSGAGGTF